MIKFPLILLLLLTQVALFGQHSRIEKAGKLLVIADYFEFLNSDDSICNADRLCCMNKIQPIFPLHFKLKPFEF
jgi:hypothetical protein